MQAKQMRQIATVVIALSGIGLLVLPSVFQYNVLGTLTSGTILGIADLLIAYGLYKNRF